MTTMKNQTTKKAPTTKATKAATKSMPAKGKDPKGGLTAAGRSFYNKQGSNLKPGVKGAADTPEKMRRKGSFLTRHFTHPSGPMKDEHGKPTRLALSAHAWGEAVPATEVAGKKFAAKGRKLLEKYHAATAKKLAGKSSAKKTATKKTAKKTTKSA